MRDMLKQDKNTKKENMGSFFVIVYLIVTFGFRMLWKGWSAGFDWLISGGPIVKVDGRRYKLVPFKIILVALMIGGLVFIFAKGENTCTEYVGGKCVATVQE